VGLITVTVGFCSRNFIIFGMLFFVKLGYYSFIILVLVLCRRRGGNNSQDDGGGMAFWNFFVRGGSKKDSKGHGC
jgi:uncharacterized membrane protein YgcG